MTPPLPSAAASPTAKLSSLQQAVLHTLAKLNRDAAEGFRQAADHLEDPMLEAWARDATGRRDRNADRLEAGLADEDGAPDIDASWTGKLHRWWMDKRHDWSDNPTCVVLDEIQTGEATIREAYEQALPKLEGTSIYPEIDRQMAEMAATREQFEDERKRRCSDD